MKTTTLIILLSLFANTLFSQNSSTTDLFIKEIFVTDINDATPINTDDFTFITSTSTHTYDYTKKFYLVPINDKSVFTFNYDNVDFKLDSITRFFVDNMEYEFHIQVDTKSDCFIFRYINRDFDEVELPTGNCSGDLKSTMELKMLCIPDSANYGY